MTQILFAYRLKNNNNKNWDEKLFFLLKNVSFFYFSLLFSAVCNFIVHEKCISSVATPCSSIAPCIIKNPVAHCWSEPTHHKRKFCTVCRKRFDESPAVHCMSKYLVAGSVYCKFFPPYFTLFFPILILLYKCACSSITMLMFNHYFYFSIAFL